MMQISINLPLAYNSFCIFSLALKVTELVSAALILLSAADWVLINVHDSEIELKWMKIEHTGFYAVNADYPVIVSEVERVLPQCCMEADGLGCTLLAL